MGEILCWFESSLPQKNTEETLRNPGAFVIPGAKRSTPYARMAPCFRKEGSTMNKKKIVLDNPIDRLSLGRS